MCVADTHTHTHTALMYVYAGRVQIFVKRVHHPVDKVVYKINALNKMFLLDLTCLCQHKVNRAKGRQAGCGLFLAYT